MLRVHKKPERKLGNYAFLDSQNINLSIRDQGWKMDWKRFRVYLKEKYSVERAYVFIGYDPLNQALYSALQNAGYHLIFKPVLQLKSGQTKGNVDAELVLQAMIDYDSYDKAVVVTGDGDFACLVAYLYTTGKLERLIVPNLSKYSHFLSDAAKERMDDLTNLRSKLRYREYKKKAAPEQDGT